MAMLNTTKASKRARSEELEREAMELRSELKKVRSNDDEEIVDVPENNNSLKLRRSYTTPQRAKALSLVESWGIKKTAERTNISENNLKKWRRTGPSRKNGSGRKIHFPEMEKKLLLYIRSSRIKI